MIDLHSLHTYINRRIQRACYQLAITRLIIGVIQVLWLMHNHAYETKLIGLCDFHHITSEQKMNLTSACIHQ